MTETDIVLAPVAVQDHRVRLRPFGPGQWSTGALIAAAVGALLFVAACLAGLLALQGWVRRTWWPGDILLQVTSMGVAIWLLGRDRIRRAEKARARGLRFTVEQLDALTHAQFEDAVRDLMRRDGLCAETHGGAGDNCCDVRGVDPDARVWVAQCKHSADGAAGKRVGTPVLQQLNGTARPIHNADVAIVITNVGFTSKALGWSPGSRDRIYLVGREELQRWATGGQPLWKVVGVKKPRRTPANRRARARRWPRLHIEWRRGA